MKSLIAAAAGMALLAMPFPASAQDGTNRGFLSVQPQGQSLVSRLIGQPVTNQAAGERIGDINDLLLDGSGRIANVVIGVGGFLGIGEKNVAVPYESLSISTGGDGKRVITLGVSKEELNAAPAFKATEKTVYMRAKAQIGK
jgi:hypothetical protein